MTKLLSRISQRLMASIESSGRERARDELLRLDPRLLEDAGLSRTLLLQGTDAWPWKLKDEQKLLAEQSRARQELRTQKREERQAIHELNSMSDKELSDLAISRGDIKRAVRFGRGDIDAPVAREAA